MCVFVCVNVYACVCLSLCECLKSICSPKDPLIPANSTPYHPCPIFCDFDPRQYSVKLFGDNQPDVKLVSYHFGSNPTAYHPCFSRVHVSATLASELETGLVDKKKVEETYERRKCSRNERTRPVIVVTHLGGLERGVCVCVGGGVLMTVEWSGSVTKELQ